MDQKQEHQHQRVLDLGETMSKMQSINEFDIVFISYDEPNADENYNDLINKAP